MRLAPLLPLLLVGATLGELGCSGPCDKACNTLVRECQLRVDSVAQAPLGRVPRGCADVEAGVDLDEALCQRQCLEWKAEGAQCVAELSCSADLGANQANVDGCLANRGRVHGDRSPTDPTASDCRLDCDRAATACGDACTTQNGDALTCGGCFDNCDRARASCVGRCKFVGQ